MLEDSPEGLKTLVLLEFTEKLIMHSSPTIFLEKIEKKETKTLQIAMERNRREAERLSREKKESAPLQKTNFPLAKEMEIPKGIIESKTAELKRDIELDELKTPLMIPKLPSPKHFSSQIIATEKTLPLASQQKTQSRPFLRIPETRLPPQFAYLRPTPGQEIQLELGKINPLADDPAVKIIEANGPEQKVIVRGAMGTKPTSIVLTKEEINEIIYTFARRAKIPVKRGITEIALGKFILSAIITDESSGFILKKISQSAPPAPMPGGMRAGHW